MTLSTSARRLGAVVAMTGLLLAATVAEAASDDSVTPERSLSLSPGAGAPQTLVTVSGSDFASGARVDIYFDSTRVATARTAGTGAFSDETFRVPDVAPGPHAVTAKERRRGTDDVVATFVVE